ncbi:MAG TPA: right-handed parallel beta-helix repeat-containing protein [Nakamurella sp.]|nr:right-handed parallel beta-helix repeat-containing protein [Nakamurella sp.]
MVGARADRQRGRSLLRVATIGVTILTTGTGALLSGAVPAFAAGQTRFVAPTGDDTDNDCLMQEAPCLTIQHAVDRADPGDTISLAAGEYPQNATISIPLTVTGAGADRTTIEGSGDPTITVEGIDAETPLTVAMQDLAVSNNGDDDGIDVVAATVALQDCQVSGNDGDGVSLLPAETAGATATISGCSIDDNGRDGVGVDGGGTVTVDHSTISRNGDGGVVVDSGEAAVRTSALDHNQGAGVVADGPGASIAITDSTISNTQPFTDREGNAFGGGVLVFPGGDATIDASTVAGNTGQGVLDWAADVTVTNSTITGTTPGLDGGETDLPSGAIATRADEVPAALTLSGTLLADNTAPNCAGDITDAGYNLSDTDDCGFTAPGSKNSAVANLGALADNGGPTQTQLPAKGSDAIDAIPADSAHCTGDATDQRGEARPAGAGCDIGAVEVAQPPIVVTPATLPHGRVGTPYQVTLQATGGLGAPYEFSVASGALPPDLTLSADGEVSGTPSESGTFPVTIAVDDPTFQDFVIVIDAAPPTTTSVPPTTSSAPQTSSAAPTSTTPSAAPTTSTVASPTPSSAAPTTTSTTAPSTSTPAAEATSSGPSTTAVAPTMTSSGPALADTGVRVAGMLGGGGLAILLGLALVVWDGRSRHARRRRQH